MYLQEFDCANAEIALAANAIAEEKAIAAFFEEFDYLLRLADSMPHDAEAVQAMAAIERVNTRWNTH